ncbi:DHA2 family efflux MFS transporter permease subunit [uncultured Limosilactobacillus sp.]|uniref:DHA2 family efflux MFS transporter permease subunit n=1 Tax=uncultured Limosilactobacillus sp. TaxID=2837629 RepID=UPI0025EF634B|nr:DHA2 family efflux MFS transporter permease subunit [uncultured Limosilactobacillus sp.]
MQKSIPKANKFLMVLTLLCGSFITAFSETLLNNGLPTIMREVHVNEMTVQWLSTGYMLAAGITMPLAAYFTNSIKLKTLFTTTMSIFLVGTFFSAIATNFPLLLIGRLIAGIAVGINMPLIPNVLSLVFSPQHRGTVMGIAGIVINFGPAIGPIISGIIVDHYSWRMLFIILMPISTLVIIASQLFVKNIIPTQQLKLDLLSMMSAFLGLGLLLYELGRIGQTGYLDLLTIICLVIGSGLTVYFVKRQFKLTNPLLEMRVFQAPSYRLGVILALVSTASVMSTELMLPLFNQNVLKVSPTVSALIMLPSAIAMIIISPIAGRLYDQIGLKLVAFTGLGLGLITSIPMTSYTTATSFFFIALLYAIRCGGLNLAYPPITVYALNALPQRYVVFGNTIMVTLSQVASAFANAMAATAQALGQRRGIAHHLSLDVARLQGFHWSFWAITALNIIAFVFLIRAKNRSSSEIK